MSQPEESKSTSPTWINKEFIQNVLKKEEDAKNITVNSINVDLANKEGSGYASQIFRVNARINNGTNDNTEDKSIIVKSAHEAGKMKELVEDMNAFQTESLVLSEVMPQIHKILKSVEGDSFRPLAAKCFGHGKQPTDYILMEDLVASGFRLADAGKPLDLEHCSLVIQSYGRLHAASAFLLKQKPMYAELLAKDNFVENSVKEYFTTLMQKLFLAAANEIKKYAGYEKYAERFLKFSDRAMEPMLELLKRQKETTKLTVLTHGDCWKNNMMFKYSENQVCEVRLVDFQVTSANYPARDLVYFLYANASLEVHRDHLDTLLAEYHSTLVATLRALGMEDAADEYPLEQLKKDMDESMLLGVVFVLMSGFVLSSEKMGQDMMDGFNNVEQFGDVFERIYDNPYSASYLKHHTLIFANKGLL